MQELSQALKTAANQLFGQHIEPELTRPEEQFGDYSTNAALKLAKAGGKQPRELAAQLASELQKLGSVSKTEVAGPGFVNIWLEDKSLARQMVAQPPSLMKGQEIVIEYSDPNPFKVLHVGHFYTSVVGDAIATMLEAVGAKVHRVNFGGDVGLHVAKSLWAVMKRLGGEKTSELGKVDKAKRADWLAECYVEGTAAYEDDEAAKAEIIKINKQLYEIHKTQDKQSTLAKIYWKTRDWSYQAFDEFYKRIGSHFEKYYPESATLEPGLELVKANIGKVFEESDGAVVFKGEVHNMHTRVFITSQGLPTYETKDVGLAELKRRDYNFDRSIIITGNEQAEYMKVVLKALEQVDPELANKTTHMTHGMVRLPGSQKMSSRQGNIVRAVDVLVAANEANKKVNGKQNEAAALGAVKYAFLKQSIGPDLTYSAEESVSIHGNSGPYLQYSHARARSILTKAQSTATKGTITDFEASERSLARKISEFPEIVSEAIELLSPSHIANYTYELAQTFNRFYEKNRVIGDPRQAIRLQLVKAYADTLKKGLGLLNIPAPDKM